MATRPNSLGGASSEGHAPRLLLRRGSLGMRARAEFPGPRVYAAVDVCMAMKGSCAAVLGGFLGGLDQPICDSAQVRTVLARRATTCLSLDRSYPRGADFFVPSHERCRPQPRDAAAMNKGAAAWLWAVVVAAHLAVPVASTADCARPCKSYHTIASIREAGFG